MVTPEPAYRRDCLAGQRGLWLCIGCERMTRCNENPLSRGWISYHGGRMCGACYQRFHKLPVGSYIELGNGCRLVKVSNDERVR